MPGKARTFDLVANYRTRTVEKPASRRTKPQAFRVGPKKKFPWGWVIALVMSGLGAWGWISFEKSSASKSYELVLKSTDKAVVTKSLLGQGVADEGAPIPIGTSLSTRTSQKSVFRFGPSASLRAAPQTDFTFSASETTAQGGERTSYGTITLERGRLWLVAGGDVKWIVKTSGATVRTGGRITEVNLNENGTCTVVAWQGKADLEPIKHPDRAMAIGDKQEASFGTDNQLVTPHVRELVPEDAKDKWLNWNLKETMNKEINEKPATPSAQTPAR